MKKQHWWAAVLALAALFSGGCATHVEGLQADPRFTYAAVMSGRIAVGGVVSAWEDLPPPVRSQYADIFARALREERPSYPLMSPSGVSTAMGVRAYEAMLRQYRDYGGLGPQDFRAAHQGLPDIRYLALARLERDDIAHDRSEYEQDEMKEDKKGKSKPTGRVIVTIRHETSRIVAATLHIYDLWEGRLVWSGLVTKSSTESNEDRNTYSKGDSWKDELLVSVVKGVVLDEADPYPAPPPLHQLLEWTFEGFAENLPEPK